MNKLGSLYSEASLGDLYQDGSQYSEKGPGPCMGTPEQNNRHDWKHYIATISLANGKYIKG